jgi:hypothetical protein
LVDTGKLSFQYGLLCARIRRLSKKRNGKDEKDTEDKKRQ